MFYCYQPSEQHLAKIPANVGEIDHDATNRPQNIDIPKDITRDRASIITLDENLEERLFSNRSELKVLISQIAMHISSIARQDLFKQIDELLDADGFSEGESLIAPKSFSTFLKFLTLHPQMRRAALTMTNMGTVGGTWRTEAGKLYIEFLPYGKYRTSVSRKENDETEYLAHEGSLKKLHKFLSDNNFSSWFQRVETPAP